MKQEQRIMQIIPESVKQKISEKYGSVEAYYNMLYKIGAQYYSAFKTHDDQLKSNIENQRLDLAEELESFGLEDGLDVIDSIWGDFDEDLFKVLYKR